MYRIDRLTKDYLEARSEVLGIFNILEYTLLDEPNNKFEEIGRFVARHSLAIPFTFVYYLHDSLV